MNPIVKYSVQRIIQYLVVIFVSMSVVFLIPKFTPVDPVGIAISRAAAMGQYQHPEAVEKMRETLKELYGLKGSVFEQYLRFWKRISMGDLGPSLSTFPTPVIKLIRNSLPWTLGLLSISSLVAWIIGNLIGGIAGYYSNRKWAGALGVLAMIIRPIPAYIMALILVLLFGYLIPVFPLIGGTSIGIVPSFTWNFLSDLLKHAFLPAFSIILIWVGTWFLTMRSIVSRTIKEDYVTYAEATGIQKEKILFQYVIRNALGPQFTGLALNMGQIFSGALVVEYVFAYPGLGYLLYNAVLTGDLNLMIGIVIFSIVGVATAVLILDLAYPLIDPRVRYR